MAATSTDRYSTWGMSVKASLCLAALRAVIFGACQSARPCAIVVAFRFRRSGIAGVYGTMQTLAFRVLRVLLTVLLMLPLMAQDAFATSDKVAIEACRTKLKDSDAAIAFRDFEVTYHRHVLFVYGTVDFEDINGIHVQCWIDQSAVREVRYLVRDPDVASGRGWSKSRPHGPEHEGLEMDAPAKAPPPTTNPGAHFIKVPQG